MNARVLVVDDEEAIRSTMKQAIDYAGHDCLLARSGQEGLDVVERESPDVVFLDIKMPGMDGLEVLKRIKEIDDMVEVVIISGHGTMETAHTATKLGAFSCLSKPIETDNIFLNIRNALEQRRLKTEVSSYRELASIRHEMVGDSNALKEVTEAISRAAPTSSTVLVHGESGVGKELVARAVHRNSRRGKERFVQVNCAALPEELIESGPAGGVAAGAYLATLLDSPNLIVTDVGGTSFEAALMENGRGLVTDEYELEWEMPVIVPMLDIRSIGAGGAR